MSPKRRKKSTRGRWWLWALGAAAGAVIAYFFVSHRGPGSASIPLPGEAMTETAEPAPAPAPAPPAAGAREEIHDSDRKALDKVLREHRR